MTGVVDDALIWRWRLLEEKGTTPETGGEARIPVNPRCDNLKVDPPLPSFTTPTPVHDGEMISPGDLAPRISCRVWLLLNPAGARLRTRA
jgi:hypothetical protein